MPLRIFLSSVQNELAPERRALRDYIHGDPLLGRFFDVYLFEETPAAPRRASEVYLEEVAACDVYLGLFGNEYGTEDATGVTATHREFDEATRLGKERLVYLKGSNDTDRHPKMKALIAQAGSEVVRRRFNSISEMNAAVYASLVQILMDRRLIRTKPFDASVCDQATLDDLSAEKMTWFLRNARSARGYALREDTPLADALTHLDLLDHGIPSHAAVLLFGKQPQRFLISSEVKCMHFHGTEIRKPIPSYQIYKGTVFELVDQAVDFVMSKLNSRVGTRAEGVAAPVSYDIPQAVVAEGIVNAIAHRDYTSGASVQVMLFSDRLEIWSPGRLPASLTLEALRRPHSSHPINPLIADPMFLAKYIEKAGTGTVDMIDLCRQHGLPEPDFKIVDGALVLTLRKRAEDVVVAVEGVAHATSQITGQVAGEVAGKATGEVAGKVAGEVTGEVRLLLKMLKTPLTRQQLQQKIGLKGNSNFRERYILPAIAAGLVEMTLPDKPKSSKQRYRLTAAGQQLQQVKKGQP